METFVYNPVDKVFGMNIQTNVVNDTFKRMKKENYEHEKAKIDGLVRLALSNHNVGKAS